MSGLPDYAQERLVVAGLGARYGKRLAIDGVNLTVNASRVTAVIGPSGCGKSTFLRCLNRIHETIPRASAYGAVSLDGENVYAPGVDVAALRRRVGMVFQRPAPFPAMSIAQNVLAGPTHGGEPPSRAQAAETLERSLRDAALWNEVKDRLDGPATALSGGQQQRLCIARALAMKPEVLLLDEPTASLDPMSTLMVEELLGGLISTYTVIIVTHNMQQAARVADETVFMLADEAGVGRVVEVGPTDRIFTRPNDRRTEDYVSGRFG